MDRAFRGSFQQDDQSATAFADFHGMEDAIEHIVSFFRHAGPGSGETQKHPFTCWGPVGGGKFLAGRETQGTDAAGARFVRHQGIRRYLSLPRPCSAPRKTAHP